MGPTVMGSSWFIYGLLMIGRAGERKARVERDGEAAQGLGAVSLGLRVATSYDELRRVAMSCAEVCLFLFLFCDCECGLLARFCHCAGA